MMLVFGSRSEYLDADEDEVEAQIIVWREKRRAKAKLNESPPPKKA